MVKKISSGGTWFRHIKDPEAFSDGNGTYVGIGKNGYILIDYQNGMFGNEIKIDNIENVVEFVKFLNNPKMELEILQGLFTYDLLKEWKNANN